MKKTKLITLLLLLALLSLIFCACVANNDLAEAKLLAKDELQNYAKAEDYRATEKAVLIQLIVEGNALIEKSDDETAIQKALLEIKAKIDELKTDKELSDEESEYHKLTDTLITVTEAEFKFMLNEVDKNSVVSAWNRDIVKSESKFSMELKPGENVIQLTDHEGKIKNYKVFYDNSKGIVAKTSIKSKNFAGDRFGFSIAAKDKNGKMIAPNFKLLANQPAGNVAPINGNITIKLFVNGKYVAESGDSIANCDKYENNSQVKEIAYVSWADTITGDVYYKCNFPDTLTEFNGFFEIEVQDPDNNSYFIYKEVNYKFDLDAPIGYITFSLDAFTIGSGYIIAPTLVPVYANENNTQFLIRMLTENGFGYDNSGKAATSFYLEAIYDGYQTAAKTPYVGNNPGKLNIPADMPNFPKAIIDVLLENGMISNVEDLRGNWSYGEPRLGDDGVSYLSGLGEFDYTSMSGWMYSVNGEFPNVGSSSTMPNDGDVIRWQFTVSGYGSDLGSSYMGGDTPFPPCEKSILSKMMGGLNASADTEKYTALYNEAVTAMENFFATQAEVNIIIQKLRGVI